LITYFHSVFNFKTQQDSYSMNYVEMLYNQNSAYSYATCSQSQNLAQEQNQKMYLRQCLLARQMEHNNQAQHLNPSPYQHYPSESVNPNQQMNYRNLILQQYNNQAVASQIHNNQAAITYPLQPMHVYQAQFMNHQTQSQQTYSQNMHQNSFHNQMYQNTYPTHQAQPSIPQNQCSTLPNHQNIHKLAINPCQASFYPNKPNYTQDQHSPYGAYAPPQYQHNMQPLSSHLNIESQRQPQMNSQPLPYQIEPKNFQVDPNPRLHSNQFQHQPTLPPTRSNSRPCLNVNNSVSSVQACVNLVPSPVPFLSLFKDHECNIRMEFNPFYMATQSPGRKIIQR
jgi:hypothetical protein